MIPKDTYIFISCNANIILNLIILTMVSNTTQCFSTVDVEAVHKRELILTTPL